MNPQVLAPEKRLLMDARDCIVLLYHMYVEYVSSHSKDTVPYVVPDTFTLVSAFAEVSIDMDVVCGYGSFLDMLSARMSKSNAVLVPHTWLLWRRHYIIDLVPLDGEFGVSLPQVVLQSPLRARFFGAKSSFPKEWGYTEKIAFEQRVDELVEILKSLQQKTSP